MVEDEKGGGDSGNSQGFLLGNLPKNLCVRVCALFEKNIPSLKLTVCT